MVYLPEAAEFKEAKNKTDPHIQETVIEGQFL